ncbi:MAG: rod shape-determining protein MreC [Thermovirgaceae bacterium]|nr:rod shape-determining protein MreC [Thermovirgaceae bacterium]
MLKRITSAWLHGLAATTVGLLFLAVSPGSPVAEKAVEYTAVILDWPERPAILVRYLAAEGVFWVSGMRDLGERLKEMELENVRLRSTLQARPDLLVPDRSGLTASRVDVRPPAFWWKEVRIDKGSSDGVQEGMPALQDGFLAGRVSRVFSNHSWVELLTSPTLLVPVVVDETRDLGVLAGDGSGRVHVLYIPEEKELRDGMSLSTALASDLLPPGLPVGAISSTDPRTEGGFRVYRVIPGADFSTMYSLFILTGGGPR